MGKLDQAVIEATLRAQINETLFCILGFKSSICVHPGFACFIRGTFSMAGSYC